MDVATGTASGFMSGAITGAVTGGITSNACFTAGTPVLTEEGLIPIEAVAAGMMVLAEDPEIGEIGLHQVVQTFVRETDELTHVSISDENGNTETINCTPEHPFYVEGQGWIGAGSLHKGMKVRFASGAEGTIKDVLCEELAEPTTIYNFEVEDLHTYYVGDSSVLVHNSCGHEKMGKPIGNMTGNHEVQNRQVKDALRAIGKYSEKNRRMLHDEISHMGLNYQEVLEVAKDMFIHK